MQTDGWSRLHETLEYDIMRIYVASTRLISHVFSRGTQLCDTVSRITTVRIAMLYFCFVLCDLQDSILNKIFDSDNTVGYIRSS